MTEKIVSKEAEDVKMCRSMEKRGIRSSTFVGQLIPTHCPTREEKETREREEKEQAEDE